MTTSKYEYKTAGGQITFLSGVLCWAVCHHNGQTDTKSKRPVQDWLNELGAEGWSLQQMFQTRPGEWALLFRREIG